MIHVPGRVGMEECSLDFFLKFETDNLFFLGFFSGWGQVLIFFHRLKLDILDKVKGFIFCNHKRIFYNCY